MALVLMCQGQWYCYLILTGGMENIIKDLFFNVNLHDRIYNKTCLWLTLK